MTTWNWTYGVQTYDEDGVPIGTYECRAEVLSAEAMRRWITITRDGTDRVIEYVDVDAEMDVDGEAFDAIADALVTRIVAEIAAAGGE